MKSIEIKTEPAGYLSFGKLSSDQILKLIESLEIEEISDDLMEIRYNSEGDLNECEGVFNCGLPRELGNEGTIVFDDKIPTIGPPEAENTKFEDGVYVIYMKLSKCSFGFEFDPDEPYDQKLLEEVCVPVNVPAEIKHGLYGHPNYNVVVGYRYKGEDIEEALEGELVDRGFDPHLIFFAIKNGITSVVYSYYNDKDEWGNKEILAKLLSSFL